MKKDRVFDHILVYNKYALIEFLWVAVVIWLPYSMENIYWRSAMVAVFWAGVAVLWLMAQATVLQKYFLPKYAATGLFSKKEFCFMELFYLIVLFGGFPYFVSSEMTKEMIDCFHSLLDSLFQLMR